MTYLERIGLCSHCGKEKLGMYSLSAASGALDDSFAFFNVESPTPTETKRNPFLNNSTEDSFSNHSKKKEAVVRVSIEEYESDDNLVCCETCSRNFVRKHVDSKIQQKRNQLEIYEKQILSLSSPFPHGPSNTNSGSDVKDQKILEDLESQLLALESRKSKLAEENEKLKEKLVKFNSYEENYWMQFAGLQEFCEQVYRDKKSLEYTKRNTKKDRERLKGIEKFSKCRIFKIDVENARINHLRLSRSYYVEKKKQMVKVDWQEINSGFGLMLLFLNQLTFSMKDPGQVDAMRAGRGPGQSQEGGRRFEFSNYKLIPKGSSSLIEDLGSGVTYHLHFSAPKYMDYFNKGLKCLLHCVNQLYQRHYLEMETFRINVEEGTIDGLKLEVSNIEKTWDDWKEVIQKLLVILKSLQVKYWDEKRYSN